MVTDGVLGVVVTIATDAGAEIVESCVLSADTPLTEEVPGSQFSLAFVDATGETIVESPFHVSFDRPHLPTPLPRTTVAVVRPSPGEVSAIEVRQQGKTLARRDRGQALIKVQDVAVVPAKAAYEPCVDVSWSAGGDEEDGLTFALSYAPAGGSEFYPLRSGIRERRATVALASLAGGAKVVVKVIATDGFDAADAVSEPFAVPAVAPVPVIVNPTRDVVVEVGAELEVCGYALHRQAGLLPDEALVWWLSRNGKDWPLGAGRDLTTPPLEQGKYRIRLVVTHTDGQQSSVERAITVRAKSATSGALRIAKVHADKINAAFSDTGSVTGTDQQTEIPWATKSPGFVQSRVLGAGAKGTPGAGLIPYLYRIVLSETVSDDSTLGLVAFSLAAGEVEPLAYGGPKMGPAEVFVVEEGGLGSVGPSAAEQQDGTLTFRFDPLVRGGDGKTPGESSFFFGFASRWSSASIKGILTDSRGRPFDVDVTGPRTGP